MMTTNNIEIKKDPENGKSYFYVNGERRGNGVSGVTDFMGEDFSFPTIKQRSAEPRHYTGSQQA